MADTRVTIAGVEWKNPVTTASGTFGSGTEFSEFVDLNIWELSQQKVLPMFHGKVIRRREWPRFTVV